MITLGVSLKAYLGYRQTLSWAARVAEGRAGQRPDLELFVLPSYPALAEVSRILAGTGVSLGAQNLAAEDSGAQTGEVTGAMLVELGCRYVAVGHAERRRHFGESDEVVAAKIAAAFRHGLIPVLCVGESDHRTAAQAILECIRQFHSLDCSSADSPTTHWHWPRWLRRPRL
jgi:triosephosphate isomerase